MTDAIKLAIEAIKLARHSHGMALMSDPPQDAWKYHKVDEKLDSALAALRAQPDHSELVEAVKGLLGRLEAHEYEPQQSAVRAAIGEAME
jgi:hypothetical protein